MIGVPRTFSGSLGFPMRRESPAARTTPAITARAWWQRALDLLAASALGGLRNSALGEHPAEVRLVLDRSLQVGLDVHALSRLLRGGFDGGGVELLARKSTLHALGPHGLGPGAGDPHAGPVALILAVEGHHRRRADDGEARGRMRE